MKELMMSATKNTPAISFNSANGILSIKGEAYPENAAEFYAPFFTWLEEYLAEKENRSTEVNVELVYFNSSSSRVLLDMFDKFEEAAKQGHQVVVHWRYHTDNDMILEYGEEFAEEVEAIDFQLQEFSD